MDKISNIKLGDFLKKNAPKMFEIVKDAEPNKLVLSVVRDMIRTSKELSNSQKELANFHLRGLLSIENDLKIRKKMKKKQSIFLQRWKAEAPEFFKKLRAIAITIGTAATSVWVANSSLGLNLDEMVLSICKYTIAFCAAVGLTSQLTAKNPPENQ
jgi:hypothetical protein